MIFEAFEEHCQKQRFVIGLKIIFNILLTMPLESFINVTIAAYCCETCVVYVGVLS